MDQHNPSQPFSRPPSPIDPPPAASVHPAPPSSAPAPDLLAALYHQLPVLVVQLTVDGTILHCNPEVCRVTGYSAAELFGRNFWSLLFPGRLFAQVPKFISAMHPLQAFSGEVPMTLRTHEGKERVIAWRRFFHGEHVAAEDSVGGSLRSIVCIGTDLTDRLLDADRMGQPAPYSAANPLHFGPPIGNLNTIEGDVIMPLAISPPAPTPSEESGAAIRQVHDFLTEIHLRVEAVENAFAKGELASIADIAVTIRDGAHACGLLDFSNRIENLRQAATAGSLIRVTTLVNEIVTICRPEGPPQNLA